MRPSSAASSESLRWSGRNRGLLKFSLQEIDLGKLGRPKTKIMLNVANPKEVFALAGMPNDGVGLARVELIISHAIRIHPMALVRFGATPTM
jgi:pyruvate,water dikinase